MFRFVCYRNQHTAICQSLTGCVMTSRSYHNNLIERKTCVNNLQFIDWKQIEIKQKMTLSKIELLDHFKVSKFVPKISKFCSETKSLNSRQGNNEVQLSK